jgi:hypothetical protein
VADTFLQLWRRLRLYSPTLPPLLAQEFVRKSYRQIIDEETWSFSYGEGQFVCHASLFGLASVTRGSNSVTVSVANLPGDRTTLVGRQMLFGGRAPIYSIVDNPTTSTVILDQPYGDVSNSSASYEISNIYMTPERPDFERLHSIKDTRNNWQLWRSLHSEELNAIDPQRSSQGTPFFAADLTYNTQYLAQLPSGVIDSFGYSNSSDPLPRFELWPRQQADFVYPYLYKRAIPDLVNPNDKPIGAVRGDIVLEGALAELASWPGSPTLPNPKYNPVQYNIHRRRQRELIDSALLRDRSIMERDLSWVSAYFNLPYAPIPAALSARFAQSHVLTGAVLGGTL